MDPEAAKALKRQRSTFATAAIIALFFADDLWGGTGDVGRLVFVRACWVLTHLVAALAYVRAGPTGRTLLLRLLGLACGVCTCALTLVHGDHRSAYFAFQLIVPLCVVLMLQADLGAAIIGVVSNFVGVVTILVLSHAPAVEIGHWVQALTGASIIAIYASVNQRSHVRAETKQTQLRLSTLEQLAASERLRGQAERMALVGQLAAGVAHEINNPLAFISSNLAFIGEELPPGNSELRVVLDETRAGLARIKGIVGDLTAFSRPDGHATTALSLRGIVDEAQRLASMRTKGNVEVVNGVTDALPCVVGNERHVCQVFLNLILNAADELKSAQTPNGMIWVQASREGANVRIDVDDNGPGIAEAIRPALFTPFFTTKPVGKGTGLGLATSREYMRRAGGELSASARPGGGARFTLTMPMA